MRTSSNNKGDWSEDELDLIVATYFGMLTPEPDAQRGWKTARLLDLDGKIGRGVNSIGRKLSNITFVASRLGLPPLQGYGALPNIQQAIYPAIQRFLVNNPATLADDAYLSLADVSLHDGVSEPEIALPSDQWTAPTKLLPTDPHPPLSEPKTVRPEGLVRLIRKFDPAARDHRNRLLGRLGEQLVLNHEIARLIAADQMNLALKVEWTSEVHGDGAGYDIRSFEPDGSDRLIEVKSTKGGSTTDFYLTRTEREVSMERPDEWRLYRLHTLPTKPRLFVLPPPLEDSVRLEAESWRARF